MRTTATTLSVSGGIFRACTRLDRMSVKMLKLTTNPVITPKGRLFPPTLPDSTTGSTGRMQGERIVTRPDKKAKGRRTIIILYSSEDNLVQDAVDASAAPKPDLFAFAVYLNICMLISDTVFLLEIGVFIIVDDNYGDISQF